MLSLDSLNLFLELVLEIPLLLFVLLILLEELVFKVF